MTEQLVVDDPELKTELVPLLVPPLQLQRRRTHGHRGMRPVAQEQLLGNQACLDRLAKTDVVAITRLVRGERSGSHKRFELVVLDQTQA